MSQQRQDAVADEIRRRFLAADHRDDAVGDDLLLGEPIAVDLRRHEGVNQPFARCRSLLGDARLEVGAHRLGGAQHATGAVGVVLEVAEDLGEVGRPCLELRMVLGRHAEHLGRHDRGQRLGDVADDVHPAARNRRVEQAVHDLLDVRAQDGDPPRREGVRGEAANARVGGRIHEEHLPHHHLGHRAELGEPDGVELRRRRRPVGDEPMEHLDHVGVARDDPRVQVRIPVDGILFAQTVVERIRIRQDFRIEQVIEAERGILRGRAGSSGRSHRVEAAASMRARIACSTSAASVSTVG